MNLLALFATVAIVAVPILGASLLYGGRQRGDPGPRPLPEFKTSTPPRVSKPARWRYAAVSAHHKASDADRTTNDLVSRPAA